MLLEAHNNIVAVDDIDPVCGCVGVVGFVDIHEIARAHYGDLCFDRLVAQVRERRNGPQDFAFCLTAEGDDAIGETQRFGVTDHVAFGPIHRDDQRDVRLATEIVDLVCGAQCLANVVVGW